MTLDRDRLRARIAELDAALRAARSNDLRATIREAIADCEAALAAVEAPRPATAAQVVQQSA